MAYQFSVIATNANDNIELSSLGYEDWQEFGETLFCERGQARTKLGKLLFYADFKHYK